MTTVEPTKEPRVESVHALLGEHMLADGLELVCDLERSHGAFLYDARRERELLDFYAFFSTVPLGFNHPAFDVPEVRERLMRAAINKPANSDVYTVEMASFVEAFARTLPDSLKSHLFFIEGGTLAVENAMKVAFDWKHRKNDLVGRGDTLGNKIIHFREAFHGRSGYTLSVTNTDPTKTLFFPKLDWPRISNPKLRFPTTAETLATAVRNEENAIAEIKQALVDHRHDVAGLLIEPIQGEGGDNHFRPEFLQRLRQLADEEDFLLLFDEVQTGFGTTGQWWCFEHFGIEPDVLSFGKKTQVCGIAASKRLDEVESVFQVSSRINSTWGGNLVDMVRCQVIVETIEQENLLENVRRVGEIFLRGLAELERVFPDQLTSSRGRGFFLAFDLPDREKRQRALEVMNQQNLLALPSGSRSIRFRPPLIVDSALATEGLQRVERALGQVL